MERTTERSHAENERGKIDKESKNERVVELEGEDRNKEGGTVLRDVYLERSEVNSRAWGRMAEDHDR